LWLRLTQTLQLFRQLLEFLPIASQLLNRALEPVAILVLANPL
jgi:hypothetical protein